MTNRVDQIFVLAQTHDACLMFQYVHIHADTPTQRLTCEKTHTYTLTDTTSGLDRIVYQSFDSQYV